ncbi:hypothetical protein D3C83_323190 [compost metagenome]
MQGLGQVRAELDQAPDHPGFEVRIHEHRPGVPEVGDQSLGQRPHGRSAGQVEEFDML